MARPKQLAPDDPRHHLDDENGFHCQYKDKDGVWHKCEGQADWYIWLMLAGRGSGKTMAGSNWIVEQALTYPKTRWAVIAPTYGQVQKVCFKGDSGIIAQALPGEILADGYNKNDMVVTFRNGSEVYGFSAENPERARGFNLAGAWLDEVGSYRNTELWDEVLQPALRKGDPRVIVTTTPSASPLLRRWVDKFLAEKAHGYSDIHVTHSYTWENTALPAKQVENLRKEYEGTRAGRQELEGEMLEDFEGALWKREFIENARISPKDFDIDKMIRIVVAVDPSMTSGEKADDSGIVVAGMDNNKEGYLIADLSCHGTPERVMRVAVDAYYKYQADCVVMEANQGGDYLLSALRAVDPGVPPRTVHAQKGKLIRAQPVSMLAEQGRLHHVGYFKELYDQLCIAAGTLITVRGFYGRPCEIPVDTVQPGNLALTRHGWRKVVTAGCTGIRHTIRIRTEIGDLVCTPDHPVWVGRKGWIEAENLQSGDKLISCHELPYAPMLNSWARDTFWTTPDITAQVVLEDDDSCTVISGKMPMGLSLREITSTIRTTTKATTLSKISLRSPRLNMSGRMACAGHGAILGKLNQPEHRTFGENVKNMALSLEDPAWFAGTKYSRYGRVLQSIAVLDVESEQNIVEPVYDLTVAEEHEFFANGILVHNCVMTPDNKRISDDRADAFVWAFSELRGITEGSYLDAYGYRKCEACSRTFNKSLGGCPACGWMPQRDEKAISPGEWARAYKNTCRKCGNVYPQKERVCPSCHPNPFTYMELVAKHSGNAPVHGYQPRSWFR